MRVSMVNYTSFLVRQVVTCCLCRLWSAYSTFSILPEALSTILRIFDAPQLSPFVDFYGARLLERAPFCYFQILIFHLKRLRLLSFLSWSLPQCDFWTLFVEDFHHASGVNLSSASRLLWLDSRNPSNHSEDYIVYGRSPYLNFDPPSKRFFR